MKKLYRTKLLSSLRTKLIAIFFAALTGSLFTFVMAASTMMYKLQNSEWTVKQYNFYILVVTMFCFFLFLLIFSYLIRPVMTYIERIEAGVREMANGRLDNTIIVKGHDELSSLALNINVMANELKEKFENERTQEKEKVELLTNLSHDLRTPLTSINGFLQAIQEKRYKNEDELNEFVNISYQKSIRLQSLVNSLLETAKLANNDVRLNFQPVDLNSLLQQLLHEFPLPDQLVFTSSFSRLKLTVLADAEWVVRLFENLLSNAAKHSSKPGEIKIMTKKLEGQALFTFTNKFNGSKHTSSDQLFKRLYKADHSRNSDGSGLGLAIVKNIAELHGGSVTAEMKDGTFTVSLKLPLALQTN